jgi:SAM-dependent methyltransferase
VLASLAHMLTRQRWRVFAIRVLALGAYAWLSRLVFVGGMLWSRRIGKLSARDRLIDAIRWGDETVLDVGCGRGLLLIAAAKRLLEGRAVRMDIWDASDQSGNSTEATLENARIEGVLGRVEVLDGDARRLPFADEIFDAVISSLVLIAMGALGLVPVSSMFEWVTSLACPAMLISMLLRLNLYAGDWNSALLESHPRRVASL